MTERVTITEPGDTIAVPSVVSVETVQIAEGTVLLATTERVALVTVAGPVTVLQVPEVRVELVTVPESVVQLVNIGGTGNGAPAFDDLPVATDSPTPTAIAAVRQDGTWKRGTWAQLQAWLGALNPLPEGLVVADDDTVLAGDDYVVAT